LQVRRDIHGDGERDGEKPHQAWQQFKIREHSSPFSGSSYTSIVMLNYIAMPILERSMISTWRM
jgi:hypothetical protein